MPPSAPCDPLESHSKLTREIALFALQQVHERWKGQKKPDCQKHEGDDVDFDDIDCLVPHILASTNQAISQMIIANVVTPESVPVGL